MSETRYWQIVNEIAAASPAVLNSDLAEVLISRVEAADAADEYWAAETLTRWAAEGARRDYSNVHKKMHGLTYILRNGRKVRKTASYSRPVRSDESGEVVGHQLQVFWGADRAGLMELRREFAAARDEVAQRIEATDRVLAAMDRHPDAKTAREAWEADGHTVDEIDLGEEGAA